MPTLKVDDKVCYEIICTCGHPLDFKVEYLYHKGKIVPRMKIGTCDFCASELIQEMEEECESKLHPMEA